MHGLKHALLSLSVTFCSAWTSTAFANVETDNSVVAASAKAHESRQLSASDLLALAEEINDAYQASVLAGFQPGQAQTPQGAARRTRRKAVHFVYCNTYLCGP